MLCVGHLCAVSGLVVPSSVHAEQRSTSRSETEMEIGGANYFDGEDHCVYIVWWAIVFCIGW